MKWFSDQPKSIRRHLLLPLLVTFMLLWFMMMSLITQYTYLEIGKDVRIIEKTLLSEINAQQEIYQRNVTPLEAEANHILRMNLNDIAYRQLENVDGGISLSLRTNEGYIKNQYAWGWGHFDGIDEGQRWYFSFDEGLDEDGQIQLAQWLDNHRESSYYVLYPKQEDSSIARITGIEKPGHEIMIQKIEIIDNNHAVDVMVETNASGESKVWDFKYIQIKSVLTNYTPIKNNIRTMKQRLDDYKEAFVRGEEMLQRPNPLASDDDHVFADLSNDHIISCVVIECDEMQVAIKKNSFLYLWSFLLTISILIMLAIVLSKKISKPVKELCLAIETNQPCKDTTIIELNTLAHAFNTAQEKLAGQIQKEKDFTRYAAHELKTPLSILKAYAECIQEDVLPENKEAYLKVILEESDRMSDLVNDLLSMARLEAGVQLKLETFSFTSFIKKYIQDIELVLKQKQIHLALDLADLNICADKTYVYKILNNLMSNAIRHTPLGGHIHIALSMQQQAMILTVENEGKQIPEAYLTKIFEPFYRIDEARNRQDGGTGLGLAIVHQAMLAHGGSCEVENTAHGVCFKMLFPKS